MDPAADPAQSLGRPAPASPDSGGPTAEASAQTEPETSHVNGETRQVCPDDLTRLFAIAQLLVDR